jgi:predicted Fe-S protein YdhL (DUF1289 family)
MCGCGRKRNEVVTSVQAAQTEQERRMAADAALAQLEAEAVRTAETWTASAAQAARNASS